MWYSRTILAAIEDAINALQSKGVSEGIIQFVHSLPNDKKGKAIGALNQNPSMMIGDLEALFQSGYRPSSQELEFVKDYDPAFQNWALYQYKQLRSNKFIDDFQDAEIVVVPSASCTGFVKNYYSKIYDNAPHQKDIKAFQSKVVELSDFLVNHLQVDDLGASFEGKVAVAQTTLNRVKDGRFGKSIWTHGKRSKNTWTW